MLVLDTGHRTQDTAGHSWSHLGRAQQGRVCVWRCKDRNDSPVLALQPGCDTSSGQERPKLPVPTAQGSTGPIQASQVAQQGGRRGRVHVDPPPCTPLGADPARLPGQNLQSVRGTAHPPGIRESSLSRDTTPRGGVRSVTGLSPRLLVISKQGRCLQESSRPFPNLPAPRQGAEPLLAKGT